MSQNPYKSPDDVAEESLSESKYSDALRFFLKVLLAVALLTLAYFLELVVTWLHSP